jgi:1-acyl-sn-glycerol-3-phosphate acyltransferase
VKPFYRFSWVVVRFLFKVILGFRAEGAELVPSGCPVILASNHRSYLDPPLIGVSVDREVHFMAKAELFSFRPFGKLISALNAHPVHRGKGDTAAVDCMVDLLKKDSAVVIFPEGTRIHTKGGVGRAKSGVARLALATNAPIVTVCIKGNLNIWRAISRREPVRVYFGRVIRPEEYRCYGRNTRGYRRLAAYVLGEIERLVESVEG